MTNELNNIFEIWHQSKKANKIALDLNNRELTPKLAIVSNNNDPENKRRIKVSLPESPALESDWIQRSETCPGIDPPLPKVGQTVQITHLDGTLEAQYTVVVNDTNPPLKKDDPVNDHYESTPGKRWLEVIKDYVLNVSKNFIIKVISNILIDADGNINITAGQRVTISNLAGASLVLSEIGVAILSDNLGNSVILGAATNGGTQPTDIQMHLTTGSFHFNLNGNSVEFKNAANVTINGKAIATIGATDTRGDTLVTKGY
ncbi:MAG: phage baseplate assembly protein V [Myxacorys californica WJT36-NPBG1]|jgi:hypothetical protein|nr:phage baseplate assembly protein V [Myxacorys californica WJT36-NPBG1]